MKHEAPSSNATRTESAATSRAFAQCSHELRAPTWLVTLGACGAHALLVGLMVWFSAPGHSMATTAAREYFEVELPPAPPPPAPVAEPPAPPPEPEPIKQKAIKAPTPTPAPAEPEPEVTPPPEPAAPAAAAAQAAEAMTQTEAAPEAPADTLVTGQGAHYAGGTTERGGTSQKAVQAEGARAFGVENGSGTAAPDRSRAAELAAGSKWDCPTPDEALEEGVERATVALQIEVDASGNVVSVEVKSDPGYGFGREARNCALRKRWIAALDRAGQPVRAKRLVNVSFF